METHLAGVEDVSQVGEHALTATWDREDRLLIVLQLFERLRMSLHRFRGATIGTDAEGVLARDLEQVCGLVEDGGDGAVVHLNIVAETGWSHQFWCNVRSVCKLLKKAGREARLECPANAFCSA